MSPDGKWVCCWCAPGQAQENIGGLYLWISPTSHAAWRRVALGPEQAVGSWRPDSLVYTFEVYSSGQGFPVNGPQIGSLHLPSLRLTTLQGPYRQMDHPAWSPDGHLLAVVCSHRPFMPEHTQFKYVTLFRSNGKLFRQIRIRCADADAIGIPGPLSWSPDSHYICLAALYSVADRGPVTVVSAKTGHQIWLAKGKPGREEYAYRFFWLNRHWLLYDTAVLAQPNTSHRCKLIFQDNKHNDWTIEALQNFGHRSFYVLLNGISVKQVWLGAMLPSPHLVRKILSFSNTGTGLSNVVFNEAHQQLFVLSSDAKSIQSITLATKWAVP